MTSLHRTAALLAAAAALTLAIPASGSAQQGPAYTLDQVERLVRAKVPGIMDDFRRDCIAFEVTDQVVARLKEAGADDAFLTELRTVCRRLPPEAARPTQPGTPQSATPRTGISPGSAAIRSLLIPGLGQFATHKPVAGILFLGAWGGSLAFGLLSKETTVDCASEVTPCPDADIRGATEKRNRLAIGVGGAVAVAIVSALHAHSTAAQALALGGSGDGRRFALEPVLPGGTEGARTGLRFRVRF